MLLEKIHTSSSNHSYMVKDDLPEKTGELTQDFRILPSIGTINDRVGEDANKLASDAQQKLFDKVNISRDGRAVIELDLPLLYEKRVIGILKKWAKFQGYRIAYNCNELSIAPIKSTLIKPVKQKYCEECRNSKSMLWFKSKVGAVLSLCFGLVAGSTYAVIALDLSWLYVIGVLGLLAGSGIIFGMVGFAIGIDEQ